MKKFVSLFLVVVFIMTMFVGCGSKNALPQRFTAWGSTVDEIGGQVQNNLSAKENSVLETLTNFYSDEFPAQIRYGFDDAGLFETVILYNIEGDQTELWKTWAGVLIKEYGDPVDESSVLGGKGQSFDWVTKEATVNLTYAQGVGLVISFERP